MKMYTVDDFQSDGCQTCCCENVAAKPGTIEKITINYAPWAVPIGRLHCDPQFQLEQMQTCPTNGGQPQVTAPIRFNTDISEPIIDDLSANVTEPDLVFKQLPLYGPHHGTLALAKDGKFTYTPNIGYVGPDRFFFSATNVSAQTSTFEVMIGVAYDVTTVAETPHVSIDPASVVCNERYAVTSFALRVSPAADMCEVWRLTVMQNALDCQCICYNRTDCFDIRMVKC